jgi:hypothetical protein
MHKARSIEKWFVEILVEELECPAQSPDLNLIKHLWDELELQLRASPKCPTSVPVFLIHFKTFIVDAVVAEWKHVPAAMFQHLVECIPRRVESVIAAKGRPTPY